jgi:hypothetical protein
MDGGAACTVPSGRWPQPSVPQGRPPALTQSLYEVSFGS